MTGHFLARPVANAAPAGPAIEDISPFPVSCRRPIRWLVWRVARVAKLSALCLPCGEGRLRSLRDQPPLLLGQRRVQVQHERVGVDAELGDNERHTLGHQARHRPRLRAAQGELKRCHGTEAASITTSKCRRLVD
jgi:hypothetical protein